MPTNDLTAAELIAVCLDTGSESAWRELVHRFQPLVASVVLRVVRRYAHPNLAIADDLVQETFLRLCRDDSKVLRQFDHRHEAAIFGYVKVVAASVANDHFRAVHALKRDGESSVDPEDILNSAITTEIGADDRLLMCEIETHVESVIDNERDRTVFWLYYRQGFSATDIANIPGIGLTAKGIESCLLRTIKAVRLRMSPPEQNRVKGLQPPSTLGEMR